MNHETIDQKIAAKRAQLRALKQEDLKLRVELAALFREKAQVACPIPLGTKIQYKDGRWGVVTRIGFFVDFLRMLDENAPIHWTVEGRKLTVGGEPGAKEFPAVGPATHTLRGNSFKPKALGYCGVNDEDV